MENKNLTFKELVQTENWRKFIKRLEITSAIMIVILVIMIITKYVDNSNFRILLKITLPTLAIYCFFIGFNRFDSESKTMSYLFYKIHGFGLAIGFFTSDFIISRIPYPKDIMIILSLILICITLVLGIREILRANKNKIDWKYFLRILLAMIPLGYILLNIY